ncbi:hypothetical protein L873DRAFT_1785533 [Choiromyces venosus 120613-1]|uniref:Uncharacterized protein n=1 Tax=Choiromyces venosus 120613-1 TaxID=1336337 RepID=A0A3N4K5N4_9PEZI|nr:hypothetical protein L873DRAFT_1785533 [Choiromyces venosus 120613-1]
MQQHHTPKYNATRYLLEISTYSDINISTPMSASNTYRASYKGSPPDYGSSFTSSPSFTSLPVSLPPGSSEELPPAYGSRKKTKPIPYRAYNLVAHAEGRSINSTPPARIFDPEHPELPSQISEKQIPKAYLRGTISEEKAEKLRRKNEEIRASKERNASGGGVWGKIKNAIKSEQEVKTVYLTAEEVAMRNLRRNRQRRVHYGVFDWE